jgi:hypothetical protein
MIVLLFQFLESTLTIRMLRNIIGQLPNKENRHAFDQEAWLIRGTEAYKASFDRKQPGYKPPDYFVEREKSSESSSRVPGFM